MNAIKAGDEQGYERAHTAWKDNLDMTFKRHTLERERFQDAAKLFDTDMTLGTTKMKAALLQADDQKALLLLENGMFKELWDLQESRNNAMVKAYDAGARIDEAKLQKRFFEEAAKSVKDEPDPVKKAGTLLYNFEKIYRNKMDTPQKEVMGLWFRQHPNASAEEAAQFFRDKVERPVARGAGGVDQEFVKRFYEENPEATVEQFTEAFDKFKRGQRPEQRKNADQEFISRFYAENPNASTQEFTKAFDEFKRGQKAPGGAAGGNTDLTIDRQNAAEVARQKKAWRDEGVPEAEIAERGAKLAAHLRSAATPITSTRKDDLASQITRFQLASDTIDKVEGLLKKHNALTGLGGNITRPGEAIGNVVGLSNSTDRAQFKSYISELQDWGPRLLNEAKARPLSAEEKRISAIVPGLSLGDTTKNTADRLLELQGLFRKMKDQMTQRYEGTWEPPKGNIAAPPVAGSRKPWERAPIVKPDDSDAP
jgi:hypothetical protein